jgi:cyanophycin synthetase
VLAAIATAYVQGVRYDDIRAGLLSFFPSPSMTPGRLNLIRVNGARLLIDYAHNAAAVEGLMDLVKQLPARRRIGVLAAPGDRRDDDIRAVGRLAGSLDHVVVKEDDDRRGRERGEVAALIIEGLRASGVPDERIEVVHSELEALDRALSLLEANDLAVVLADDVNGVLEHVRGS